MTLLIVLIVVVLIGAALFVVWWQRRRRPAPPATGPDATAPLPQAGPLPGPQATITLDIAATDTDEPSVQRLVQDAADQTLRTSPDVEEVLVENRDGVHLATITRHQQPLGPPPDESEPAPEAQASPPRHERAAPRPDAGARPAEPPPSRSLAARFDLPPSVHATLRDPDSPVDLIRAVLAAADVPAEVEGNVIRSGEDVVIVIGEGARGGSDAFTNAFLKFQKTGASRGLVVSFGHLDRKDVERRQALAPNLRYVGTEAVQRMADAAAVGGDPLTFARDPAAGG